MVGLRPIWRPTWFGVIPVLRRLMICCRSSSVTLRQGLFCVATAFTSTPLSLRTYVRHATGCCDGDWTRRSVLTQTSAVLPGVPWPGGHRDEHRDEPGRGRESGSESGPAHRKANRD